MLKHDSCIFEHVTGRNARPGKPAISESVTKNQKETILAHCIENSIPL